MYPSSLHVRIRSTVSLRSWADLVSFFVRFVFNPFSASPWLLADVPDSMTLCPKGKVPIILCISGITMALIAESIPRESLIFISYDRSSIDSSSLSSLGASFPASISLISFSWNDLSRRWGRASGSLWLESLFITFPNSLSSEFEFSLPSITSIFP